jgi:hypothetical protein
MHWHSFSRRPRLHWMFIHFRHREHAVASIWRRERPQSALQTLFRAMPTWHQFFERRYIRLVKISQT